MSRLNDALDAFDNGYISKDEFRQISLEEGAITKEEYQTLQQINESAKVETPQESAYQSSLGRTRGITAAPDRFREMETERVGPVSRLPEQEYLRNPTIQEEERARQAEIQLPPREETTRDAAYRAGLGRTRGITAAPVGPVSRLDPPYLTPEQEKELSTRREVRYLQEEAPQGARAEQRFGAMVGGTLPGVIAKIVTGQDYAELTGFDPVVLDRAFRVSKTVGEVGGSLLPLEIGAGQIAGVANRGLTLGGTLARRMGTSATAFGTQAALEDTARQRVEKGTVDVSEVANRALGSAFLGAGFAAANVAPALLAGRLPEWMVEGVGQAVTARMVGATLGGGVAAAGAAKEGARPTEVAANFGAFFLFGILTNKNFDMEFKQAARNSVVEPSVKIITHYGVPREVSD